MSLGESGFGATDDYSAGNRATYNRIATRYFDNQVHHDVVDKFAFPLLAAAFVASLTAGAVMADLGCGPAIDGWRFAEEGFRVAGMDLSEGMLAVATNRLRGRLAQADLRSLPIASSGLDAIWCVASLLHVPEPDTATVLGEFRRILRSAGQLALVTALGDSAEFEPVPYAPDEQRWYVFRDRDRLLDQLETAGFRVEADDRIAGNRDWLTVLAEAI